MAAVKVLRDHARKLAGDNEYLERQIVFLTERVEQYKMALGDNRRTIENIERTIDKLIPHEGQI